MTRGTKSKFPLGPWPRIFIFDLDGTLADAYPAIFKSFNAAMAAFGYREKSPAVIRKAVGWGDQKLLEPFVRRRDLAGVLAYYREHHARALSRGSFWMPGARPLLRALKKSGARVAIASNRPSAFTRMIVKKLGMERFLDVVQCADRLRDKKPSPWTLRNILRKLSLRPEDALYVGDMAIDIQAAKRARVSSAAVATGSSSLKALKREKPDYLFRGLAELRIAFLKNRQR
ncbi:MAG: HAD family hydrolase [Candidatus Omnitrophota bacterium]